MKTDTIGRKGLRGRGKMTLEWQEKTARYIKAYRAAAGLEKPPKKRTNKDNCISAATREKNRLREARRRQLHGEEINARQRARYASDTEYRARKLQSSNRYNRAHKEEMAAGQARRRAMEPEKYRDIDKRSKEKRKRRMFAEMIAAAMEDD